MNTAVRRLLSPFSMEITPRETTKLPPLTDVLAAGSAVYLTFLPRTSWLDTVSAAKWVADQGMRPVPHLAARAVPDRKALQRMLLELAEVGVDDLLVVAGGVAPVGEFHESAQILESGCLEEAGIHRVGVAGHPEGHPDVPADEMARALATKNRIARERGLDMRIVTQFCFAADPILVWERRIREAGNALPVHVGLPGLTSPTTLLRFGLSCGVGASLKVLRHQAGGVLRLAATPVYQPEETLLGVAAAVAGDPACLIRAVHFFPFGALVPTAEWATELKARHAPRSERSA